MKKAYPRYLPWIIFAEDRDLGELCFTVQNRPGELAKALQIIAKYGVNIVSTIGYSHPTWNQATITLAVDVTDIDDNLLKQMLKELEANTVGKVLFKKNVIEGFLVSESAFPIYLDLHTRVLLFSLEEVGSMLKALYDKYGDVTASILYNLGYGGGVFIAKMMVDKLKTIGKEKLLIELLKILQAAGWALVEVEEMNLTRPSISLKLYENFECKALKYRYKPSSNLVRGYLSGLFSTVLDQSIRFRETRCIAVGDEYCRLVSE